MKSKNLYPHGDMPRNQPLTFHDNSKEIRKQKIHGQISQLEKIIPLLAWLRTRPGQAPARNRKLQTQTREKIGIDQASRSESRSSQQT
jgi:hypothetical protein